MLDLLRAQLTAHLQRHARTMHRIACGLGRARDADDVVQTLYTRWWRRLADDPEWAPPETHVELFVAVRHSVLDLAGKEARQRRLSVDGATAPVAWAPADESLHALERLEWILTHLSPPLAEVLQAALAAGRHDDRVLARELGLTPAAFTGRLFKARRAAEELALAFDALPLDQTLERRRRFAS